MAESIIFILIVGIAVITAIALLGWHTWINLHLVVLILFLFLVPGLYGAFTTGPFVPSSRKRHRTMLKLANLRSSDIICDLGCGDGRLVFKVAPHVREAIGYELSIPLVLFGKIRKWLTRSKAEIHFANIWKQDYSNVDILFCYLMPPAMKRLSREIWPKLKPGARVITNAFRMHDLKPIAEEESVYVYQV